MVVASKEGPRPLSVSDGRLVTDTVTMRWLVISDPATIPIDSEPDKASDSMAIPMLTPLLVSIRELAVLLCRSEVALHRDDAAGRLPRSIRLGGSKRWRRSDIEAWVSLGCPSRREFEARSKTR